MPKITPLHAIEKAPLKLTKDDLVAFHGEEHEWLDWLIISRALPVKIKGHAKLNETMWRFIGPGSLNPWDLRTAGVTIIFHYYSRTFTPVDQAIDRAFRNLKSRYGTRFSR